MLRKSLIIGVLLAVSCSMLWAAGRKDNISRTAEDPSAFTDVMDTSEHKPGKYNFYLEATDKAGNVTRSGPDNIFIDPASDLPRVTIINPMLYMRVQGNLNMVGIAMDDDGVAEVHLTVHRGRDTRGEELVRAVADGTDYWSYFLDTTDPEIWTDGPYTITAWAVDINGLSGIADTYANGTRVNPKQHRKHSLYFYLDRRKPDIVVTSHDTGALVAGNIRLRGTVYDGNGIRDLRYSIDGGDRYINVPVKEDKKTGIYNWDINLSTKVFEDGPAVLWFKSRDMMGSEGVGAHLLFVNNTGPKVEIVYPPPREEVNGIFTVAGYASHPVGLKKVTWKAGKKSGEIELLAGNHWWSTPIDIRGEKINSIDVEIRAEDVSGNVTVARQRYRVNQNADLPVVTVSEPVTGAVLTDRFNVVVKGTAVDNDGVSALLYSVNGGAAVEIPCSGYFQFMIPELNEGANTLEVWARDITGVVGNKVLVRNINVPGDPVESKITRVITGSGNTASNVQFNTGMQVTLQPKVRVNMDVEIKAMALTSASIKFGETPEIPIRGQPARDGFLRTTIQVPERLPSGLTPIKITTTDRNNRALEYFEYVYIEQNDPAISPSHGGGFEWVRTKEVGGRIFIGSREEMLLGLAAQPVHAPPTVSGEGSESVRVTLTNEGCVTLQVTREGIFGPLTLSGSVTSRPFSIIADFNGPQISIREAPSDWVQTTVPVSFNVSGQNRITAIDFSTNMGETWQNVMTSAEISALGTPVNENISRVIDIRNAEDGAVTILLRAVNAAERSSLASFSVLKDTQAPEASLVMPIEDYRVNGTIRMGFSIVEAGKLKSVTYNKPQTETGPAISKEVFNANSWDNEYAPVFLEVLMDSLEMPLDDKMSFTFEDMAGNSSVYNNWTFVIAPEDDIPVVHIILPLEDEVITSDFVVSGVMFDDDGIKGATWSLNGGPWQEIDAENGFSIPIPLSAVHDNENYISVIAEDVYGVKSEPVTRNFRVSLEEPKAQILFPLVDTVLRDVIEISGVASDKNGIKEVQISIDNGNSFNKATGAEEWAYSFNTKILRDGPHVVFIRVFDNYDIPATYASMINIDNTPPDIALDSPDDGSISIGRLNVMGRALDPNLESITIEIKSLTGQNVRSDLRSRTVPPTAIIRETFDLVGQADGHYNMEVIGVDRAGNITRVSRNFELARETYKNYVEVLYPLDNEVMRGEFYLYGFAGGVDPAEEVTIRVNGRDVESVEVDASGYYRFSMNAEHFSADINEVIVHSNFGGGETVLSKAQNIVYSPSGPWVTIDSFNFGDFAYERPYVFGRVGYILSEEDQEVLADRKADRELRAEIQKKVPDYTEISFDNGKTFFRTNKALAKGIDYRYRLETGDMIEGMHYIFIRSTMKNGETAITRMLVQVDKTPPVIRLISPEAGEAYNTAINYSASASDDVELVSLTYHLRAGDKAAYEIPGFLQGLYFEAIIPPFIRQITNEAPAVPFGGGATYMDIGFGLSFFDDNVKIQANYGWQTNDTWMSLGGEDGQLRYGGDVFGFKLLANIYTLPFGAIAGPDWEWLSASFGLGANFSLFSIAQSGSETWLSALLLQIEFPKMTIPKQKAFRTYSFFTEGQLWFVPTDVDAEANEIPVVLPKVVIGFRIYVF